MRCQSGGESFGRRRRDVSWTEPRASAPNQTSPLYVTAHKPTIVVRPYPLPPSTPPEAPPDTSEHATTTLPSTEIVTNPSMGTVNNEHANSSTEAQEETEEPSPPGAANLDNTTDLATSHDRAYDATTNATDVYQEEITEKGLAPIATPASGVNATSSTDSPEMDETDPPIMFRKQEMFSSEELKPNSSDIEAVKLADGLEHVSSAVVFGSSDSKAQRDDSPVQYGAPLPQELTPPPFGGYGMGYGSYYPARGRDKVPYTQDFQMPRDAPGSDGFEHRQGEDLNRRYFQERPNGPPREGSHSNPKDAGTEPLPGTRYLETAPKVAGRRPTDGELTPNPEEFGSKPIGGRQMRQHMHRQQFSAQQSYAQTEAGRFQTLKERKDHQEQRSSYDPRSIQLAPDWFTRGIDRGSSATGDANQTGRAAYPPTPSDGLRVTDSKASGPERSFSAPILQEIVATTERPYPEEVPLSLAIIVGEDSGVKIDNGWARNSGSYHPPRSRKRGNVVIYSASLRVWPIVCGLFFLYS